MEVPATPPPPHQSISDISKQIMDSDSREGWREST